MEGRVGILSNMKDEVLHHERYVLAENTFAEIATWRVSRPVHGSMHRFKCRLALVADGECVLRCDNVAGKGDHRHVGDAEHGHAFARYEQLLSDFWADVESWRRRR